MLSVCDVVVEEVEVFVEICLLRSPCMLVFFVYLIVDVRFAMCASGDDSADALLSSVGSLLLLLCCILVFAGLILY